MRSCSAPLEFRSRQQQRQRVAARTGAAHRLQRVVAQQWAEIGCRQFRRRRACRPGPNSRRPSRSAASSPRARPSRRRDRASHSAAARHERLPKAGQNALQVDRGALVVAAGPARAALATTKSCGVRSLAPGCQAASSVISAPAAAPRSPPVSRSTPSIRRTASGGRFVGDEVPHQLARPGSGGWPDGWRGSASAATPPSSTGGKAAAHDRLRAGLVRQRAEAEARRVGAQVDRPAGQDLGEAGDVGLGVAGGRADGVQFQAFARQVLVQPAMAALSGRGCPARRTRRCRDSISIAGWRMTASSMSSKRPVTCGRIASSTKAQATAGDAAADRDGEMVGPEPDQPLAERRRRGERIVAVPPSPRAWNSAPDLRILGLRLVRPVGAQRR